MFLSVSTSCTYVAMNLNFKSLELTGDMEYRSISRSSFHVQTGLDLSVSFKIVFLGLVKDDFTCLELTGDMEYMYISIAVLFHDRSGIDRSVSFKQFLGLVKDDIYDDPQISIE